MSSKSVACLTLGIVLLVGTPTARGDAAGDATAIIKASGVSGGLVVHVGCGQGKLTAALRANERYLVHGLDPDATNVARAREYISSLGLYGKVSVEAFNGESLPYVDNLVNLLVADDLGKVTMAEVMRVLAPNGVAYIKGPSTGLRASRKTVKPRPSRIDEWTHWMHGPDGNAVADDTVVGPPRHAQWIAAPRWQRHHEATPSVSTVVSAGGRLFAIINEAPPGIDGMPDQWALVARDAFNGKLLWKRRIDEWGWRQWNDHSYGHGRWNHPTHLPRRLVATGDRLYVTLGFNAPLTALDAVTGRTVMTYPQARFTDEVLYHAGTLVLAVNNAAQGPGRVKAKPPVKKSVLAMNARTGEVLWKTGDFVGVTSKADAIERVTHLSMIMGGGKVYLIEDDAVVALDLKTGKRAWRRDRPERPRVISYGSYHFSNLCTTVYHDGMVLFIEPNHNKRMQAWNVPTKSVLTAISAQTGKVLWTRECGFWGHYNPGDIFVIDGIAWVHDGQSMSMVGLDPRTGKVKRTISTKEAMEQGHHHRCYRNKATVRHVITSRRGLEFIDLASGRNLRHHWVRGTCRYGILPANGLLYAPPHPCICYITAKLNGFWALAAKRLKVEGSRLEVPRLEKGSAFGKVNPQSALRRGSGQAIRNPQSDDWPTYRRDAGRSGSTKTTVPARLKRLWQASIGGRASACTVADGRVFAAAIDQHRLCALDAASGKPLWTYTTGGRIDTPPTVYRGLALFGSTDGWVYCLRAADGKLAWRRRAAPEERRMMNREQLESPWPVHGSVLVRDGVAYFAAGRSSFLDGGITVYAVDPATGKLLRSKRIHSLDPKTDKMVAAPMRYDMPADAPGALPDVLVGDEKGLYMRHLKLDPASLDYRSAAPPTPAAKGKKAKRRPGFPLVGTHLMSVAGLLDDSWFNQTYWTIDGKWHSKLLVFDDDTAYNVKSFPGSARHSRAIFTPGKKGYTLAANQRSKEGNRWAKQVPVRVVAMVAAGRTLFIAGTPDVVAKDDPWGAIEGRKGAVLWAVSAVNGEKLAEYTLGAAPAYDSLAAAGGRLYVAMTNGKIVCMGAGE